MGRYLIKGFMILILGSGYCLFPQESDLSVPEMKDQPPAAGLRVRVTSPEYSGTAVHHSLYLPVDWEVVIKTVTIFGGFEDKRTKAQTEISDKKILIIKGLVLFGGGELKN